MHAPETVPKCVAVPPEPLVPCPQLLPPPLLLLRGVPVRRIRMKGACSGQRNIHHLVDTCEEDFDEFRKPGTPSQQVRLIKMSPPAHFPAVTMFDHALLRAINSRDLQRQLQSFAKQRDNGWGPSTAPLIAREWPAVVLEVGLSERASKLQPDAQTVVRELQW